MNADESDHARSVQPKRVRGRREGSGGGAASGAPIDVPPHGGRRRVGTLTYLGNHVYALRTKPQQLAEVADAESAMIIFSIDELRAWIATQLQQRALEISQEPDGAGE